VGRVGDAAAPLTSVFVAAAALCVWRHPRLACRVSSSPQGSAVSAVENTWIPFIGRVVLGMQCVIVDRSARGVLDGAVDKIRSRCAPDSKIRTQIVMFAEGACRRCTVCWVPRATCCVPHADPFSCLRAAGTTTNQRALISFKRGAFIPGVPVQPVVCRIATDLDPAWVSGGPTNAVLQMRMMCSAANQVRAAARAPLVLSRPSPWRRAHCADDCGVPAGVRAVGRGEG
jgi:hypothetical protein